MLTYILKTTPPCAQLFLHNQYRLQFSTARTQHAFAGAKFATQLRLGGVLSLAASIKCGLAKSLNFVRFFQNITLVEQLLYFVVTNQLSMSPNSFMRLRYSAVNFLYDTSKWLVNFSTPIQGCPFPPHVILEILLCFLYTELLAIFSQLLLNQLLQQKLRRFLLCFCVFAGMTVSILP